jgi:hypothetical protein
VVCSCDANDPTLALVSVPLLALAPDVDGTLKSCAVDVTAGRVAVLAGAASPPVAVDVDDADGDAMKLMLLVEPELRLLAVIAALLPSAAAPSLANNPEPEPVADGLDPAVTLKVWVPSLESS